MLNKIIAIFNEYQNKVNQFINIGVSHNEEFSAVSSGDVTVVVGNNTGKVIHILKHGKFITCRDLSEEDALQVLRWVLHLD